MSYDKQVYTFSYNLKYLMVTYDMYGLTQKQLADAIGVGQTTVSSWLRGAVLRRRSTIEKLAIFFGLEPSQLIDHDLELEDLVLQQMGANPDPEEIKRRVEELQKNDPYSEWRELQAQLEESRQIIRCNKDIIEAAKDLNNKGKKKVASYAKDLACNPDYKKEK